MDVQGSQFHLLHGRADWGGCTDAALGVTLGRAVAAEPGRPVEPTPDGLTSWEYDDEGWRAPAAPRHAAVPARRAQRAARPEPSAAGPTVDADGTTGTGSTPTGAASASARGRRSSRRPGGRSTTWHDGLHLPDAGHTGRRLRAATCTCPARSTWLLAGLRVTTHALPGRRLRGRRRGRTAGLRPAAPAAPRCGCCGRPATFDPWDLATPPDGGALVLDREPRRYWRLDEHLRLRGTEPTRTGAFAPVDRAAARRCATRCQPDPRRRPGCCDATATPLHPISIEPGPGGTRAGHGVRPAAATPGPTASTARRCAGRPRWRTSSRSSTRTTRDRRQPAATRCSATTSSTWPRGGRPLATAPMLYVADSEGDQVVAFTLDPATGELRRPRRLPAAAALGRRRWLGAGEQVWYDFGETAGSASRSSPSVGSPPTATLRTPLDFDGPTVRASRSTAGRPAACGTGCCSTRTCPTGTTHRRPGPRRPTTQRRCSTLEPWVTQPVPYLRSGGSELPWADPWADRRGDVRDPVPLPDGMGTYELLFQQVTGRYLPARGDRHRAGRVRRRCSARCGPGSRGSPTSSTTCPPSTPSTTCPDRFLERFLANPEGLFTALEERIEHSHLLLDPRTTPGRRPARGSPRGSASCSTRSGTRRGAAS